MNPMTKLTIHEQWLIYRENVILDQEGCIIFFIIDND